MIVEALKSLRPSAEWSIDGGKLTWLDKTQARPSDDEITAEVARLQAEYDAEAYQRQRAAEYPPIGDQLDALWKGGDAAAEMLAAVQAIKLKYPKP